MINHNDYAIIGYCAVCGQGRQFVARETSTAISYVCCEDCESEWASPVDAKDFQSALQKRHGASTYVTIGELRRHSWFDNVLNK